MNKKELQTLINLLHSGKWNLSLQESNQIVAPLINKLSKMLSELDKPKQEVLSKKLQKK